MSKYLQNRACTLVIMMSIFLKAANGQEAPDLGERFPCLTIGPTNLVADSISSPSARLSATIRESRIVFKYKPLSSDSWLSSSPVDPSWIHSLLPATSYEFYAIATSTCPSSSAPVTKTSYLSYFTTLKKPSTLSSLNIFPVPVQRSTTVYFKLAEAKTVSIKIFDMTGRTIKTIASEQMQAGDHQFVWIGKDEKGNVLNPGIYFLRIEAEDDIETRKIIAVR